MKKLFSLLFLSVVACGVEMAEEPQGEEETSPSAPLPRSYAAPATLQLSEISPAACTQIWECERCGSPSFFRTRNVLVEYCDDGSQRNIIVGPCPDVCF